MNKQTLSIDTPFPHRDAYGALSMPVYHSCAYEFPDAASMTAAFTGKVLEPDYSRTMNPTVTFLEQKVKAVTGATDVFAFNSGMAAISNTLLAIAAQGTNIVTSRHLFGNTYALLGKTLRRFGIEARFVDLNNIDEVRQAVDDHTCLLFLEIITNPQMEVADLRQLSQVCHEKQIPLIADTTMIPFTQFSARDLGVDIELVSSTKYISGGATSLGGLVIEYGCFPRIADTLRNEMLFNLGAYMTPHAAYMQSIGLETLHARYAMQSASALTIAQTLDEAIAAHRLPHAARISYPALPSSPYYALAQQQFGTTGGAMITLDMDSEQACYDLINRLQLIRRATNLFDNRTLAIHPYSTIFGNFTPEEKAAMDVLPTTIRLSIGLESPDDILADLFQAAGA